MDSQNSYYSYPEKFIFHQTNSPSVNCFLPSQTISNDPYFPSTDNSQTGHGGKEDKRRPYIHSNEYGYRINPRQAGQVGKEDKISRTIANECNVYWPDNSFRSNNLITPKFEENNLASRETFMFKSYGGDRNKNNKQNYNHYNSYNSNINFDYNVGGENKTGETPLFDEITLNKYNTVKDNRTHMNQICPYHNYGNSYCGNTNNCITEQSIQSSKDLREQKCELTNNSNYSEYCDDYSGLGNYFGFTGTPNISELDITDQQTQGSNGGSDIIVEESEDERYSAVQYNEHICNRCVVCNLILAPHGVQFYYVTSNSPVTMTSQRPVLFFLRNLIRNTKIKDTYICCECLVLLNTIDHFQSQLDNYKNEFRHKLLRANNNIKRITLKPSKILSSYQCKYCKKMLYFKNYCYHHIMKHKRRNILCEKCGILCKSGKMFYRHICLFSKISKPSVMQALTCVNCNKIFRTKVQLKEHHNYCLGILPYICKIPNCGKKFATFTRMKNHGKLKHDKKFIAICSICNIGFIKISDYKSHKVIHSNDKKFQCQKCGRSYKTVSNLNFHLKSHQQSLPYSCNICQKGFMRKEYLETHMNNHKEPD
ncbi:hypothetical protein WA026_012894 [Henosepilachna vigintioctopunctata]|uniref:C2H2-type domain-containing protein n=1 Tax=Henosepilachna vigintioctopunctata TaxID=420089 RepID=A0AAW1TMP9_9CUCU